MGESEGQRERGRHCAYEDILLLPVSVLLVELGHCGTDSSQKRDE